ncbi:MAG: hypothetical protein IJ635_01770 [Bacteroidaceae bacterium]|nr:hypothetical protein [Bacteroidaceae bacterium]
MMGLVKILIAKVTQNTHRTKQIPLFYHFSAPQAPKRWQNNPKQDKNRPNFMHQYRFCIIFPFV